METKVQDEVVIEPMHETDEATLPAVIEHHEPAPVGVTFTDEQVALIKETVCNPGVDRQGKPQYATDAELDLFLQVCRRTGLDPFARQIYAVFRWNPALGRKAMQVQTSIDGFRVIAERSSTYAGPTDPLWCGKDGKWTDVWLEDGYPAAAKAGVNRHGFIAPATAIAKWDEFVQTDSDGKVSKMWKAMPTVMLAKCAEAQALRKAFPNDLSGLYTAEEMGQADNPGRAAAPFTPPAQVVEVLRPATLAKVREGIERDQLTAEEITAMVHDATNGRTTVLAEVHEGDEFLALREARKVVLAARDASDWITAARRDPNSHASIIGQGDLEPDDPESDGLPDNPEFHDDNTLPDVVEGLGRERVEQIRAAIDPSDTAPCTTPQRTAVNAICGECGHRKREEKLSALSAWLGRAIASTNDLTASEAGAIVSACGVAK